MHYKINAGHCHHILELQWFLICGHLHCSVASPRSSLEATGGGSVCSKYAITVMVLTHNIYHCTTLASSPGPISQFFNVAH